jgi:hypothetical protein
VLDDVDGVQGVERGVAEGVRKPIQVAENVGTASGVPVDSDSARQFIDAASDVENSHGLTMAGQQLPVA